MFEEFDKRKEYRWFFSTIWYVILFNIISLGSTLFLLDDSTRDGIFVLSVMVNFLFIASYMPLVILAIWNGTKILMNKIDNKFSRTGKCVLPSTWIASWAFAIFCSLTLLFIDFGYILTWQSIFFAIYALLFISKFPPVKKFDKYIEDVSEKNGEIYYQGRQMSKWEKTFFKLARTLFVYYHIPFAFDKDVITRDGVVKYKGRIISELEIKLRFFIGLFAPLFISFILVNVVLNFIVLVFIGSILPIAGIFKYITS